MSRLSKQLPPLETLLFFEAVVRCGSFTKAAHELHLTQGAVSKQIKTLEQSLGVPLFERQARGISLNTAGSALYAEVSPLLQRLQATVSAIRTEHQQQSVSITCTQSVAHYWLFPRIVAFNRLHPQITISIQSTNDVNESSCARCDLGILYGDGNWSTLHGEPLYPEVVFPICHAQLDIGAVETLEQLQALPLIQLDSSAWDCMDWRDWFRHFGVDYRPPRAALTFNQNTLAFNAVLQGMGVGLGWDFMARELIEAGTLRQVGPLRLHSGRLDYLVHARHKKLSPPATIFYQWLLTQADPQLGQNAQQTG